MSGFRLVPRQSYIDPCWGGLSHSLYSMERGMRDMDRQFGDMFNQLIRLSPMEPYTQEESPSFGRQHSCDVGFPDANVQNPVVTDKEGNRRLCMQFDVCQFKPEEISIKSFEDNKIEVSAKHETKDDNHRIYREYHRLCTLPEGTDLSTLKSNVHPSGVLIIEAPLPAIEAPKPEETAVRNEPIPIAIQHQKK